jgi:hypothetical protein
MACAKGLQRLVVFVGIYQERETTAGDQDFNVCLQKANKPKCPQLTFLFAIYIAFNLPLEVFSLSLAISTLTCIDTVRVN